MDCEKENSIEDRIREYCPICGACRCKECGQDICRFCGDWQQPIVELQVWTTNGWKTEDIDNGNNL